MAKLCYSVRMGKDFDRIVLDLLNARRGEWQAVAAASGVSYSWLSKFSNGHIENPGIGTLRKLHVSLAKRPAKPELAQTP